VKRRLEDGERGRGSERKMKRKSEGEDE